MTILNIRLAEGDYSESTFSLRGNLKNCALSMSGVLTDTTAVYGVKIALSGVKGDPMTRSFSFPASIGGLFGSVLFHKLTISQVTLTACFGVNFTNCIISDTTFSVYQGHINVRDTTFIRPDGGTNAVRLLTQDGSIIILGANCVFTNGTYGLDVGYGSKVCYTTDPAPIFSGITQNIIKRGGLVVSRAGELV